MSFVVFRLFFENIVWRALPKAAVLRAVADSKLLTTAYFSLRGSFYHEQRSILNGQAKYYELEEKRENPRHRVIRNVHRIEKGLSMRNRRPVFAEGYIENLVDDLITAWNNRDGESDEQLYWAVDVLTEYFGTVDSTETIAASQRRFEDFFGTIDYTAGNRTPKPRRELESEAVSYDQLKRLAKQRTSTRWFEQRAVPRDLIDDALEIAAESPSACNRQSYEFRFYDDDALIEKVSELPIGVSGYRENIPCLAVLVGKQRAYFDERDKHVVYIDASLAAMAFQYGLETLGLASCCINWPSIPEKDRKMAQLLDFDGDEEVIMLMAIGYPDPDGMIPYSEKKDLGQLRSFNVVG
ncbi:nitroreductase family protein [Halococcus sp. PRR34]|uniref:nitroreductase family protein n=1 Tax=Halococcus sp. PRR34 TaxID=3020830 RepID=UPI0023616ABA|nr:nitroreductase family protein [Halococcus sp. PRR34]